MINKVKLFITIFISLFLFMPNVFAYEEWPSKISLTLNSSSLSTTNRVFTNAGKLTFNLLGNSVFVPTYDDNQIRYGYISVCQAITHPIDTYSSGIYTKDFKVYETSIPCSMYGTSAYPDSRVIYMTFELNLSDGFMCSTGTSTTYCNLDNDLYIQQVGTNEWTLNGYGFSSEPFIYDSSESTIINQNSQIIDKQEQTNNKLDNIGSSITDESSPDLGGLSDSAGWLPAGPVDSILNLPLNMLNNISTSLSQSCSPVSLPLPFVNKNIELPCINTLYAQIDGLSTFIESISVIISGLILYSYFLKLYKWVDEVTSMKETNTIDDWGGV